jgi:hypothetical protein
MLDRRYKVTPEIIKKMKAMRKAGFSYKIIGEEFGLSQSTANYWLDKKQRLKQRQKNSKKRHELSKSHERYMRYKARRQELWKSNPNQRLRNAIYSALYDENRKTVMGMSLQEAKTKLNEIERLPNGKID